ncbi:MAG: hypothetical protein JXR07_07225 [Reichenbachiella sp.]
MKFKILILILTLLQARSTIGQYKPVQFGQNRVQYKNFEWFFYGTDNYDIHFYALGEEYTKVALEVLDEEFEKITDLIGYAPFAKTKIFIYNSPTDMLQSNIGVGVPVFSIAGETKFVKLQLEVAYPGSIIEFRKELKYKLSLTLLNDMMFGGSLTDVFQNAHLLHLPEWFTEGAARYVAFGWDIHMDDFLRDFLSKKKIKNFSKLEGEHAALVGQSVWNYIAVRYGKSNLSNILNLTRIIRNEENSVASSLGISYEQFIYEWTDYYSSPLDNIDRNYIAPEKEDRIVRAGGESKLTKLKISPDGTKMAYVENYIGKYKVVIKELETGKERIAHKGGYHIIDQEISYEMPLIDWASNNDLAIIEAWYGTNYLVTYDVQKRTKNRKSLIRFNQVNDISFNDNGKLAVISADVKGQTDLYLISMRRNAVKRLTKDPWDDLYPEFIPGTDAIVFSSNRTSDSLGFKPSKNSDTPDMLNLYAYDLDTTSTNLFRLTNTLSNDIRPVPFDKENIYYLSDLKGINNMYKFSFQDSSFTQVTNYRTSMKAYDINTYTKDLSFLMLNKGKSKIYLDESYDLDRTVFTPPTVRHQVKQLEYMRNLRDQTDEDEWDEFDEEWKLLGADSVSDVSEEFAFGGEDDFEFSFDEEDSLQESIDKPPSEFIDLDHYEFGPPRGEYFFESEPEPTPNIEAEMDNPLNFLFGDQVLQRRDSLLSDSVGIRSLSYRHPSEFSFEEELTKQDSIAIDSLAALGINYRHPPGYEYQTDSVIHENASVGDAYFRHPPGYENNDYSDMDYLGDGNGEASEFIDLENYQFGKVKPKDTGSFMSRIYNTSDPIRIGEGNFAVDTTLYKTPDGEYLDTDDYEFADEAEGGEDDIFSFLSIYLKIQKEPEIVGPLPFETSFNIDHVVTSFALDQFRGFGILLETQMSDILENHKFNGGFMLNTDFHSGDFFAEYRFLKYTIDMKARFDRTVIYREGAEAFSHLGDFNFQAYTQKYKKNTYTVGAALPMKVSSRFELNGFMAFTEFYNLNPEVLQFVDSLNNFPEIKRESHHTYGGFNAAWVYDNTLSSGLNLFEGSRGKIQFEHFQCLTDNSRSFSNLTVDLRRYQKLHRELIIATRLYYGRSFGNRPKTYMLGGMDNWMFAENDNEDQIETPLAFSNYKDNTDMLFAEFVNLRGFDYNRFSGANVLAVNAELRWPIVKYFSRGAIKSDFLRNLQFIGFYDIGSAWTGLSPFDEDNSVDTRLVKRDGSPFEATIRSTRNPWLASYGFGLRTVLFGYYTRFDVARPIEDYDLGDTRFYLTIGYDF